MIAYAEPADAAEEPDAGSAYVKPEATVWLILAACVVGALLTPNPLLTAGTVLVVPVLVVLLWRRGEVPILLFAAGYQWLQVTAKVFHANLVGAPVREISLSPTVETAIWTGLVAVVTLALGMRTALRGAVPHRASEALSEALRIPFSRAATFYLVCAVAGALASGVAYVSPGFTQLAMAISGVKWIGFFVFGFVVVTQRRGFLLLAAAIVFEFVQGIGFFSDFKTVFFVMALVALTARHRLSGRTVGFGLAGLAGLLVIGSAWTAVKSDYRNFLNQGSGQQVTVVSEDEQFDMFVQLVGDLTWEDVTFAFYPLLARVAYVDYLAAAMDYVPAVVPHERGQLWLEAVQHTLVPRLVYPDKPVLASDSEHSMYYTGLNLASDGTSISLGYVTDSYIDFGPFWMFVPVFLAGLLWGGMYRYFLTRGTSALLAFGFAMAALLAAYKFEIAAVKLIAGVTVKFLALAVLMRFVEPWMREWLHLDEAEHEEGVGPAYAPAA